MIQDLANKIWANPTFHEIAGKIELAWLRKELGSLDTSSPQDKAARVMQAAAILACSVDGAHRRAAFRVATCTYELFGAHDLPLDQALRVVLARLGNFPAFGTRTDVNDAISRLPAALAIEEVTSSDGRAVQIGSDTVYLTDFQKDLWNKLHAGNRVAIAAPTSAGKSFVLEGYLASSFTTDDHLSVVYIVPTRALIAQVADDLMQQFKPLGEHAPEIVTIPLDNETHLPKKAVYVMTQERIQILASTHKEFMANLVIVDEAHAIADGARGILLQWVIDDLLERRPDAQVLFASPNVRNLDIFGRLFGLDNVSSVSSSEPTVAQNFLVTRIEAATKGKVRVFTVGDGSHEERHVYDREIGQTIASRKEKLVHVAASFGLGQSNIIYANGAAEAESVASQLAELFKDREPTSRRLALSDLASEAVHPQYALVKCAKVGVAFHYSNIPTHLRRAIEAAVLAGDVDYLVCTSTLLQGVNLPAKNIFMFAPEKGRRNPLASTDFWNLAGRAGRLRREFQGNIFLIDYDSWKEKPLRGPRDAIIVPAIERNIRDQEENLVNIIRDEDTLRRSDNVNLETTFVRLFSDLQSGRLDATFGKIGIELNGSQAERLASALTSAKQTITLPARIIRNSPNISVHKQQRLFDELSEIIEQGRPAARDLLPKHPRESGAYDSYANILERCQRIILGIDTSKGLHRFHALMATRWMQGMPLPQIIQSQIVRKPQTAPQTTIRNTLEIIENDIRFQAVRMFGCYIALLVYALDQSALPDLVTSIPSIPVYLEVGASDKTMISFISLGLSRVAAMKLNDLSVRKDLDPVQALAWLKNRSLQDSNLSPLLYQEIQKAIAG